MGYIFIDALDERGAVEEGGIGGRWLRRLDRAGVESPFSSFERKFATRWNLRDRARARALSALVNSNSSYRPFSSTLIHFPR